MTRLYGVIGDPVHHSLSPLMHQAAYEACGLTAYYVPLHVKPDKLKEAIAGLRAMQFHGANVTIPHKEAVIPLLDAIDTEAEKIGAVNTIINEDGILTGYNTDGTGYLRSLLSIRPHVLDEEILLLGAGGAARAAAITLTNRGASVTIANRTVEKAEKLAAECGAAFMSLQEAEERQKEYPVIINSTSIGMYPDIDQRPLRLEADLDGCLVSDMIYNPWETKLLHEAEQAGAQTLNGFGMFIQQGADAFERWTGDDAPVQAMERAVREQLLKRG
ncbi:shikimate dehydrogenase [Alkalicoccus chagannorensis]|uniref:shikimate dehydrogenase n=1 Tax=Alkalicoccus chagannorensis TaxID=427072 RepID=UPI0004163F09|nr:shikimate dehydrogenase [Alkalicoccus chagannorensis]